MIKKRNLAAFAALCCAVSAPADSLEVTSLPSGYSSTSIELGHPYGGSLASVPGQPHILYVSLASGFNATSILKVDTQTGTTSTVATSFGNIGGLAVLNDGSLAIIDNGPAETILRAVDGNTDGDFLDAGEVTELITPILTNTFNSQRDFTGAQAAVAPAGNASGIPTGSLLVQTADGGTDGEILVVRDPTTAPAFRPAGAPFYGGIAYNGGLAFDPAGNMIVGTSEFPNARIVALKNTNSDEDIDTGESNVLVNTAGLPNSIADLAVTAEGRVIFSENSGNLRTFDLPADVLTGTGTPTTFAQTNGAYLSTVRLDAPTATFAPAATGTTARLYVGGFVTFIAAATNLLCIQPSTTSAVGEWQLY